jgi:1-acyl-sn-glycerol-3-phosphate acyltransferase
MARAGAGKPLSGAPDLLSARPSPPVRRWFAWYAERLLRKSFAALRALPDADAALAALGERARPTLLVTTHSSWWDPIVIALLWRRYAAGRPLLAPMDRASLQRFRFFRRLGVFGIDPDDPRSLEAMATYVVAECAARPDTLVAVTPQGRFTDPREPIVLRPGAARLAALMHPGCAVAVAIEYAFWTDRKPELFLGAARIARLEAASTASWQRALADGLRTTAARLAEAVRSRDEASFVPLVAGAGRGGSGNHPIYDLWLRGTGRSTSIEVGHRAGAAEGSTR